MRNLIVLVLLGLAIGPSVPKIVDYAKDQLNNVVTPDDDSTPVVPATPTSELGKLVPDVNERAKLITFFRDLATLLEKDTKNIVRTTSQLRTLQDKASSLLVHQGAMKNNPDLWTAIGTKQAEIVPLDADKSLDSATKSKASAFYRQLATELSQ
jgi:hypothetical protein